jgi:hypothetical protein
MVSVTSSGIMKVNGATLVDLDPNHPRILLAALRSEQVVGDST